MSERREHLFQASPQRQDRSDNELWADDLPLDDLSIPAAAPPSTDRGDVEASPQRLQRQTNFAFIHNAENAAQGKSDADDLPTIRSHAMRNVRRERRLREEESRQSLPQVGNQTANSTTLTSNKVQLNQSLSYEGSQSESIPYNPLSTNLPYANSPDFSYLSRYTTPFPTSLTAAQDPVLRSSTGAVLDQLVPGFAQSLQYFVTEYCASIDPAHTHLPVLCAQIAIFEGHAALLHTICYVAAVHQALVKGIDIRADWSTVDESDRSILEGLVQHKDKALHLLNYAFSNLAQACTDTAILTVSLFLITESLYADTTSVTVHAKGLGQMLEQRGGREAIPHEVFHYVLMADVKTSILTWSTPSFSLTQRLSSLHAEAEAEFNAQQILRPPSTGFDFLQPQISLLVSQEMMECCHVLCYLMNLIEDSFHSSTASPNLRTHFLVLEHRLLSLSVEDALAACCRLALILYCNVALWSWPKASSLIQSLLHHLQQAIRSCGPNLHEQGPAEILIWCLLLASFASTDEEIQNWYIQNLQDLLSRKGVTTLSHVQSLLPGCFYVARVSEYHLRSLNTKLKLVDDISNLSA
jgi:hypothetical protein